MDLGHGTRGLPTIGLRPELAFAVAHLGCRVVNLPPKAATAAVKRIGKGWVGIYAMDRIGLAGAVGRGARIRQALDDVVGTAKETGWVDVMRERGDFYLLARDDVGVMLTPRAVQKSCIVALATLQKKRHWPGASGVPWHKTGQSGLKLDKVHTLESPIGVSGKHGMFIVNGWALRDCKQQVGS